MTQRIFLLLLSVSALALATSSAAEQIYKTVDEDGVVVYSDMPSPDADQIEVVPNVVETNPVKRRERPSDDAATTADSSDNVAITADSEDIVVDEDPGRATRNAVRALSQPRPQPR